MAECKTVSNAVCQTIRVTLFAAVLSSSILPYLTAVLVILAFSDAFLTPTPVPGGTLRHCDVTSAGNGRRRAFPCAQTWKALMHNLALIEERAVQHVLVIFSFSSLINVPCLRERKRSVDLAFKGSLGEIIGFCRRACSHKVCLPVSPCTV